MEKLKTYWVQVILKSIGPKVAAGMVSAFVTILAAHQQLMEQMGITFYRNFNGSWHGAAPTGQLITIELDTLTKWGAIALVAGVTALISLIQHHGKATVTGAPQSGDMRKVDVPISDGTRYTDLPPAA